MVVPKPDGSVATYHEECSPWAEEIASKRAGGLELLSRQELQAIINVVHALVDHDDVELRRVGAIAEGSEDPYEPTRRWRLWPMVDLVLPPGDPIQWEALVIGTPDERGWSVEVRMWTVQEKGPSELVLHLDVAGPEVFYRGMW